jgi:hypothetical protein
MSDDLREQIYLNFSQHETEELLEIWRTHDRNEWSETTFDVIREILQERHVELPPQVAKARKPQRSTQRSSSNKWLPSQLRWIPLALSFALVLILNAWILVQVNQTNPNGWVKGAYVGPCLPVSAVILAICAWFGGRVAKKDGGNPWKGSTIGVWIGAIPAIALSLWGLLGIGGGQ